MIDPFITEHHLTVLRDRWGAHDRQITWSQDRVRRSIHLFVPEGATGADIVIELSVWLDDAGTRHWMDWPTFRHIPAAQAPTQVTKALLEQAHRQAEAVTEAQLRTNGKRTALPR